MRHVPHHAAPGPGRRAGAMILAALALAAAGCGGDRNLPSVGSYSDVLLISETGKSSPQVREFVQALAHPIRYVFEDENEFNVFHLDVDGITGNTDARNIVFLVRIDEPGALRNRVTRELGRDYLARTREEGHLLLYKQDFYARDQDVYYLLMANRAEQEYVLARLAPTLCQRLRDSTRERYRRYLLRDRENKGGGKYLWQNYGFTLRFPADYHLLQERRDLRAIELHRTDPSRGIAVFWRNEVKDAPGLADSTALLDWRAEVADTLYSGDTMLREETVITKATLGEHDAIRAQGVWQNERDMTGGVFITYFIHDTRLERLLAVDLIVYAPGLAKHPYVRELEALASTLRF
ncbi:MAG: DUF4837 family protein [Candidatus Krumholzibacteriota bacterium]|nr:DUF4837 family protein [Candidatus Krumholzibacteriota bacterium]